MVSTDFFKRFDPRSSWPGFLLVAGLATSIALAALAPSASEGLPPGTSLLYWLIHVFLALGVLTAAQAGLQRLTRLDRVSPWLIVVVAGVLGACLFTPIALALDQVFPTIADEDDGAAGSMMVDLVDEFGNLLLPFLLIWTGFNATRLLQIEGRASSPSAIDAPPSPDEHDDFWSRVPAKLGRDLVAISSELHYLRVYTSQGDALILHAFGRALERLGALDGLRIHRSHWVVLDHVLALRREGEKVLCQLDNGIELPVSRPYRSALRSRLPR